MGKKETNNKIACPHCNNILEVGEKNVDRAVVAVCVERRFTCPVRQWGSPTTRESYPLGEEDFKKVSHVIQFDVPETEEEKLAREEEEARKHAAKNHPQEAANG